MYLLELCVSAEGFHEDPMHDASRTSSTLSSTADWKTFTESVRLHRNELVAFMAANLLSLYALILGRFHCDGSMGRVCGREFPGLCLAWLAIHL